jgi:hypothetical protein
MSSIIVKESQLVKLIETAMDLDIYVQPVDSPVPGQNDDFVDSLEDIQQKIKELIMMANNGEKINHEQRGKIFSLLDLFNKVYENIKFVDKSEIVPML